eukprot:COSAG05_NODE_258_length_12741_cov_168.778279_2_plen_71_part_00
MVDSSMYSVKQLVDTKNPAFVAYLNENGYSRKANRKRNFKKQHSGETKKEKEKFSGDIMVHVLCYRGKQY